MFLKQFIHYFIVAMKIDSSKHATKLRYRFAMAVPFKCTFKKFSKIELLISLNLMNNSQCNFGNQDCFIPDSVEFLFVALNCKWSSFLMWVSLHSYTSFNHYFLPKTGNNSSLILTVPCEFYCLVL